MWLELFGVMGGTYVPTSEPSVTSVTASLSSAGLCAGTSIGSNAVVRGTFAIANANYALYTVKVYLNNVLRQTLTSAGTTHDDYTAPGVEGDSNHTTTVHLVWRVDVVRNSGGAVISSKSSSTYTNSFGDCNGPR